MSAELRFDAAGLVPAVVQDRLTGEVRMVAWMSAEALARTLETGRATFFSRSRGKLWEKGESSGNSLVVAAVHADCDADTLLVLVDPRGPSCHTGAPSCFFRRVSLGPDGAASVRDEPTSAAAMLEVLEREIASRKASTAARSYTKSLLEGGAAKIGAKLREEADELARAIEGESDERVANEAADLVYHALVGLASRGVEVRRVLEVLAARQGTSGHVEKASRAEKPIR